MDTLVKITGDTDGYSFQLGALPALVNVTTFYVGPFGPYTVRTPKSTATAEVVAAAIQAKVDMLRQLGAI